MGTVSAPALQFIGWHIEKRIDLVRAQPANYPMIEFRIYAPLYLSTARDDARDALGAVLERALPTVNGVIACALIERRVIQRHRLWPMRHAARADHEHARRGGTRANCISNRATKRVAAPHRGQRRTSGVDHDRHQRQ